MKEEKECSPANFSDIPVWEGEAPSEPIYPLTVQLKEITAQTELRPPVLGRPLPDVIPPSPLQL